MDAPIAAESSGILDLVHDSVVVRDMAGRIVEWNAAAEAFYGWSREQAVGADLHDLLRSRDVSRVAEMEARLLAEGGWEGELCRTTRSGAEIWIDLRCSLRRDAGAHSVCVVETGRDVSDRRRDFEALERSELRYRSLFNYMPIALWQLESRHMRDMFDRLARQGVTDFRAWVADHPEFLDEAAASMTISEANDQTLKLFAAADRETLLARMPGLWIDREDFADAALARLSGQRYYSKESAITTLDGRRVEVLFSVAFADPDNPASLNLVGAVDISATKRASAALAESELKYRNLFQHMPMSLWQIDTSALIPILGRLRAEGVADLDSYMDEHPAFLPEMMQLMRVEQVNAHTVALFGGRGPEDFAGPVAHYWQDSPDTVRRSLVARFAGAESHAEETRVRALDGRAIDMFYTSAFPAALSEMGIGLVGAIDIGDRLEAERRLRQVEADFAHAARVATLGELTASIAHEVNQPLAAVVMNGNACRRWLATEPPNVAEARQAAERVVSDGTRAGQVIARVRALVRGGAPERRPLDVNDVIRESLAVTRDEAERWGASLRAELHDDLPPVAADRVQVQQVLVNLILNGVEAMADAADGPARVLTVRSRREGPGAVRVEVADRGKGLDPEHPNRIFDAFFSTKPGGLGLGLSISRSIVEAHGGRIWATPNDGPGATVVFTLPDGAGGG